MLALSSAAMEYFIRVISDNFHHCLVWHELSSVMHLDRNNVDYKFRITVTYILLSKSEKYAGWLKIKSIYLLWHMKHATTPEL